MNVIYLILGWMSLTFALLNGVAHTCGYSGGNEVATREFAASAAFFAVAIYYKK